MSSKKLTLEFNRAYIGSTTKFIERCPVLLLPGKYSDLTFRCQGYEFHVHRLLMAAASKKIEQTLDKSRDMGATAVYEDNDHSPMAIFLMSMWVYLGTYAHALDNWIVMYEDAVTEKDPLSTALADIGLGLTHTKKIGAYLELYQVAIHYGIEGLEEEATWSLDTCLSELHPALFFRLEALIGHPAWRSVPRSLIKQYKPLKLKEMEERSRIPSPRACAETRFSTSRQPTHSKTKGKPDRDSCCMC